MCRRILEKCNRRVEVRHACDDILSDIAELKPHIILMDLWIPRIGGEQAIMLMKNDPSTSAIPVILFSANSEVEKISKKVKADGYLEKPFNISDLRAVIDKNIL